MTMRLVLDSPFKTPCFILMGGYGTRVRHLAPGVPKALLPIASVPFLELQLKWLKVCGVDRVHLLLGYQAQQIIDFSKKLGAGLSQATASDSSIMPEVSFSVEGDKLLGTGGAIKAAADYLPDYFFVTYGDSFLFLNPVQMEVFARKNNCDVVMSIFKNNDTGDRSNVLLTPNGMVHYDKKNRSPEMKYIDYGFLCLKRDPFLAWCQDRDVFDLSDYLHAMSLSHKVWPFEVSRRFYEVGSEQGVNDCADLVRQYWPNLNRMKQELLN